MKKLKNKKTIIFILILLISSLTISFSYSRYTSAGNYSDQIRVAKSGELNLIEKINGEIQDNSSDIINNISYDIISDDIIDKEVYIEFMDAEVSTYLFLIIDSVNWTYDNDLKVISLKNNSSKLLSFNINNEWNFIEEVSSGNKFVFYRLIDINNNDSDKYDVMNQISVGFVNVKDKEIISNSSLRFSAYSIQKSNNISAIEAWNYLNL